mmetsp:Transcript_29893/g.65209  ORF Transcript_29893/g.65209 Transcript_29893/m.65209 type:complete len:97 (+) Transcript_29893:1803-2093(+)
MRRPHQVGADDHHEPHGEGVDPKSRAAVRQVPYVESAEQILHTVGSRGEEVQGAEDQQQERADASEYALQEGKKLEQHESVQPSSVEYILVFCGVR